MEGEASFAVLLTRLSAHRKLAPVDPDAGGEVEHLVYLAVGLPPEKRRDLRHLAASMPQEKRTKPPRLPVGHRHSRRGPGH